MSSPQNATPAPTPAQVVASNEEYVNAQAVAQAACDAAPGLYGMPLFNFPKVTPLTGPGASGVSSLGTAYDVDFVFFAMDPSGTLNGAAAEFNYADLNRGSGNVTGSGGLVDKIFMTLGGQELALQAAETGQLPNPLPYPKRVVVPASLIVKPASPIGRQFSLAPPEFEFALDYVIGLKGGQAMDAAGALSPVDIYDGKAYSDSTGSYLALVHEGMPNTYSGWWIQQPKQA